MTSPKSYLSISKAFLNNKIIPCIQPLLHDDKFIENFERKAEIFNNFFAKQRSLINTNHDLPSDFSQKAHKLLSTIHFTSDDILQIIKNPDPNKTRCHDMIIIRMIKICDASIDKTFQINRSIMS